METLVPYSCVSLCYRVLTVPMRNGNVANIILRMLVRQGSYRTYEEWKLPSDKSVKDGIDCSYRTYEEWKLVENEEGFKWCSAGSYRTYEEWKRICYIKYMELIHCSYRTYEEWKQACKRFNLAG